MSMRPSLEGCRLVLVTRSVPTKISLSCAAVSSVLDAASGCSRQSSKISKRNLDNDLRLRFDLATRESLPGGRGSKG